MKYVCFLGFIQSCKGLHQCACGTQGLEMDITMPRGNITGLNVLKALFLSLWWIKLELKGPESRWAIYEKAGVMSEETLRNKCTKSFTIRHEQWKYVDDLQHSARKKYLLWVLFILLIHGNVQIIKQITILLKYIGL